MGARKACLNASACSGGIASERDAGRTGGSGGLVNQVWYSPSPARSWHGFSPSPCGWRGRNPPPRGRHRTPRASPPGAGFRAHRRLLPGAAASDGAADGAARATRQRERRSAAVPPHSGSTAWSSWKTSRGNTLCRAAIEPKSRIEPGDVLGLSLPMRQIWARIIRKKAEGVARLYWNPSLGWLESPWAKAALAPFTLFMR